MGELARRGVGGELPRRRGRAREAGLVTRIKLDVVIEGLERIRGESVGILFEDFLSNDCVSPLSRSPDARYCQSRQAKCGVSAGHRRQPSRAREMARCVTADRGSITFKKPPPGGRVPAFSLFLGASVCLGSGRLETQPTGGEVVLKSSEATELECEGVRGATCAPINWYGGAPGKKLDECV